MRQIPPELGRCEHLRALVLGGNPQRSVRVNTIQEGTEAVLKHLRNRLPLPPSPSALSAPEADTENIPPPNRVEGATAAAARLRNTSNPLDAKRARTNSSQPSSAHQQHQQSASVASASATNSSQTLLLDLDTKIATLEATLEDFALTAAKKFAVKKELAMVRSQKIRLLRTTSQP